MDVLEPGHAVAPVAPAGARLLLRRWHHGEHCRCRHGHDRRVGLGAGSALLSGGRRTCGGRRGRRGGLRGLDGGAPATAHAARSVTCPARAWASARIARLVRRSVACRLSIRTWAFWLTLRWAVSVTASPMSIARL